MTRRLGLALLVLLVPAFGRAAEPPERLLAAGTQIYLRWDGIDAHRMAYEKTALGKMLQGDTGAFLASLLTYLTDLGRNQLTVPQLLGGISPDRLQKLQADAVAAPKLLETLGQHGLVL